MADRVLAEFRSSEALAAAIRALRERGYGKLEAYLPFPAPDVEEALAERRSRLPIALFAVGISGAAGAYLLQWLLVAHLYPLNVGGRPPHFPLAFLIITFEMGILLCGIAAVVGVLVLGRLVRLTDDVQGTPGFESASGDRFWLELSTRDPLYRPDRTRDELVELGASRVELAGGAR
ncbi:MAG TPA: DUF3341 domain-containing protein [Kofleriaceae bacterium]|nr:DUF3341 domain-containing protein [Kofleriaceae bacterium]